LGVKAEADARGAGRLGDLKWYPEENGREAEEEGRKATISHSDAEENRHKGEGRESACPEEDHSQEEAVRTR
jgi:hypothetical protein